MTMVIINMIIAYLGSLFTFLEQRQEIIEKNEKAQMTLDLELIIRLFKRLNLKEKLFERNKRKASDSLPKKTILSNRYVFIIKSKEEKDQFQLNEDEKSKINEEEDANVKLVRVFKSCLDMHTKRSEKMINDAVGDLKSQLRDLQRKLEANNISFRQQDIDL